MSVCPRCGGIRFRFNYFSRLWDCLDCGLVAVSSGESGRFPGQLLLRSF